jgi:hypothetical protein
MSTMTPKNIEKLIKKGRLVPLIKEENDKFYLIGYTRKSTSRKNDKLMLPQPELLQTPTV